MGAGSRRAEPRSTVRFRIEHRAPGLSAWESEVLLCHRATAPFWFQRAENRKMAQVNGVYGRNCTEVEAIKREGPEAVRPKLQQRVREEPSPAVLGVRTDLSHRVPPPARCST